MSTVDVMDGTRELAFPQSIVDLVSGRMGQTQGGFLRKVRERILSGEKPLRGRPGSSLPNADFDQTAQSIRPLLNHEPSRREAVSHLLYPKVFADFARHQQQYGDTSVLPTPAFLYGLKADPNDPTHVAATMPGMVLHVAVQPGNSVVKGQKLLMLEAMKMQTIIAAERDGKVDQVLVKPGSHGNG